MSAQIQNSKTVNNSLQIMKTKCPWAVGELTMVRMQWEKLFQISERKRQGFEWWSNEVECVFNLFWRVGLRNGLVQFLMGVPWEL